MLIAYKLMERQEPLNADFESLGIAVTSYLKRYCGDEQLAQDLAQETLLRVSRSLPQFDGRSSLKTWAFSIAHRVVGDYYRRSEHSLPVTGFEDDAEFVDVAPEADQRLIIDDMNKCVREVIDTLPEDYRAALILRDLECLSVAEVALVSNCSLATAKIRIHRARKRLRDALDKACEFYSDEDDVLRCDRK